MGSLLRAFWSLLRIFRSLLNVFGRFSFFEHSVNFPQHHFDDLDFLRRQEAFMAVSGALLCWKQAWKVLQVPHLSLERRRPESFVRTEGVSKGFCYSNAVFFTFSAFFPCQIQVSVCLGGILGIKSGTVKAYSTSVQSRESCSLSRGVCARTLFRDRLPKMFLFFCLRLNEGFRKFWSI